MHAHIAGATECPPAILDEMRKRVLFFLDNASIGRAAMVCRHFGARQPGSMHKQLRNLSSAEATLRVRYHSIAPYPGCPVPQQPPASRSVGASEWLRDKAMWSRAHATPGLEIEGGVLKGMAGGLEEKRALLSTTDSLIHKATMASKPNLWRRP